MVKQGEKIACSLVAILLGLTAFAATQIVTKETMDPIVEVCTVGDGPNSTATSRAAEAGFHPFEPRLGGNFICIVTQFFYDLVKAGPEGEFVWGVTMGLALPYSIVTAVEAGRTGARGVIRYTTPLGILMQILGISVIFPALWVPGFCFGGSETGSVRMVRVQIAAILATLAPVLTILLYTLDTNTYAWTITAGLVGCPFLPCVGLVLWPFGQPTEGTSSNVPGRVRVSKFTARVYDICMYVAIVQWIINVRSLTDAHGYNPKDLYDALWTNANASVAFMTVDMSILYFGFLVHFVSRGWYPEAVESLVLSVLIGPGASCCNVFAKKERDRAEEEVNGKKTA